MKTLPKNAKIIRYLKDTFDVTHNELITNEMMKRLKKKDGVAHVLVNRKIPPKHKFEWGGVSQYTCETEAISFLHALQREKDILFLFAVANFLKTDPFWEWVPERNVIFCDNHPFYFASPFDSDEHLKATLRRSGNAGPSFGLIVKGDYVFTEWQDITESTLRNILKDTIAIITTVFDNEAYLVYEFQK